MTKKLFITILTILILFNLTNLIYGATPLTIQKVKLIYHDGTSEEKEFKPVLQLDQYENYKVLTPLSDDFFSNSNGKYLVSINIYIKADGKEGWLKQDGSLTSKLGMMNVLVGDIVDPTSCGKVLIEFAYNVKVFEDSYMYKYAYR